MAAKMIRLELPEGPLELLGPPDAIAGKVRETLVLDLLREAQITQPLTAEEAERDVAAARQGVRVASVE